MCKKGSEGTESEDFTLDSDDRDEKVVADEETEKKELVFSLKDYRKGAYTDEACSSNEDRLEFMRNKLDNKLDHLPKTVA